MNGLGRIFRGKNHEKILLRPIGIIGNFYDSFCQNFDPIVEFQTSRRFSARRPDLRAGRGFASVYQSLARFGRSPEISGKRKF